jgi:hypothetical protein
MQRSDIINQFISRLGYERYLEIGVQSGVTFNAVNAPTKVAVDPAFVIPRELLTGEAFEITSDTYFNKYFHEFDLIFIDGLHTFEQSLRDLMRSLRRIPRNGLILIDDCYPSDYLASLRDHDLCAKAKTRENHVDRNWMGDVYKTLLFINDYLDDVSYIYITYTMGFSAVWYEPRQLAPYFQTMEEIYGCEYARFRYEISPSIPRNTVEQISERVAPAQECAGKA